VDPVTHFLLRLALLPSVFDSEFFEMRSPSMTPPCGKAANKQQAMAGAKRQVMDTVVEFDERIDPRIRIMAVAQDSETGV
jgi:hypothetical protein